jgi:hypothetical protein
MAILKERVYSSKNSIPQIFTQVYSAYVAGIQGGKWGVSAKDAALLKPEIRKVVFSRRQGRGTI